MAVGVLAKSYGEHVRVVLGEVHLEAFRQVRGQLFEVGAVRRGEDQARDAGAPRGDGLFLDAAHR